MYKRQILLRLALTVVKLPKLGVMVSEDAERLAARMMWIEKKRITKIAKIQQPYTHIYTRTFVRAHAHYVRETKPVSLAGYWKGSSSFRRQYRFLLNVC